MIPKKLHYVWVGDQSNIPKIEIEWMEEAKALHPEYEVTIWSEKDVPSCKFMENCIEQGLYNFAADYIRVYALYHHGGFYLDTDMRLVKPIPNEWRSYESVVPICTDWFSNNFFWGNIKKGRVLKSFLTEYLADDGVQKPLDEEHWVAPSIMDRHFKKSYGVYGITSPLDGKWVGNKSCKAVDKNILCPYMPWDEERINDNVDTSESIGIHYWNNYKVKNNLDLLSFDSKYFKTL